MSMWTKVKGFFARRKKQNLNIEGVKAGNDFEVYVEGIGQLVAKNIQANGDVIIVIGTYRDERGRERQREIERIPIRRLLTQQVSNQLAIEKNSKKYIPDIFVEVTTIKDQLRYFSCPVLFIEKILDEVRRIRFDDLNRILQQLSLPLIALEVDEFNDITLVNVYEQASALRKVLSDVNEQLDTYSRRRSHGSSDSIIPQSSKYNEGQIRWLMESNSSSAQKTLETAIENLNALIAQVFFIVSRAGQGKTNLVCDFVEKALLPRSINCVYFTGREFNHVRSEDISKYFINSIFGDRLDNLESALDILSNLATESETPIILVIDGINEHRDIAAFSHHLERFIEKLIQYPNIKVLLTCRAEYYEDRFGNFDIASFREKIYFKKDLNRHMRNIHKEQLLEGYLRFFKLRAPFISRQADEILKNDTLLLRIFCEAYGDPNSIAFIQIPSLINIYRDSIFRKYFERKLAGASQNLGRRVGVQTEFNRLLREIITAMIENRRFTDIPVSDLDKAHYETLELLLGEDVVVRKDLANVADILDERIEVLNFTFDEFRDFLLANHLVNVVFYEDVQEFSKIMDEFVEPNSSIAEGVRTYLFFASRQKGKQAIHEEIKQRIWYDEIFIRSIFSAEETLIQQTDLDTIRSRFEQDVNDAKWILKMLTQRWNTQWFPNLNINLLFEILSTMNDETYDTIVRECFTSYSYIFRDEHMWSVQNLAEECEKIVENGTHKEQSELLNLFRLLIYLFPIKSRRDYYSSSAYRSSPAFDAFIEFSKSDPAQALELLRSRTTVSSYSIRAEIWRMLVHMGLSELPDDLAQEAIEHVMEYTETEDTVSSRWIKEVIWFLERYAQERDSWWVNEELLERMRLFSKRPHIYDWYANN